MTGLLGLAIGVGVAALAGFVLWRRSGRPPRAPADPIAASTGSNRTLTGVRPPAAIAALDWDEALRRFVAYALDDAPRESLSQPPDPAHAPVFAAVAEILGTLDARPDYIPRRPSLLPKLLATVNDGEASMVAMARIIEQDPALTGNLLRVANSPLYRLNNAPIESIDRAVTMVGVQGIRSLIASALLHPVMVPGSGTFSRFPELVWEHTLFSATAAETHAVQVENAEPFVSQLVGLLHGLAAIVVFRIVRDQFAARPELNPDAGSVARLLESWVSPTAGRIAANWELSSRIQYALESQSLAVELQMENAQGRSLKFGRVAGALVVLCRLGRVTEAEARAILQAGETGRTAQIARLWDRFSSIVK